MNFYLRETGQRTFRLPEELFPLCRSLTGDGVRQTVKILQQSLTLEIYAVASGCCE
jgi:aminopeptidase-like protein